MPPAPPGFAAVVLLPPAPAPVKPDREVCLPSLRSFRASSCARAAELHCTTKSATAMNLPNIKRHFILRALHLQTQRQLTFLRLSTLEGKATSRIRQDMGSSVHKSGFGDTAAKGFRRTKGRMKSTACGNLFPMRYWRGFAPRIYPAYPQK